MAPRRGGRRSTRSAVKRTPSPAPLSDGEMPDVEMQDAPMDGAGSPQQEEDVPEEDDAPEEDHENEPIDEDDEPNEGGDEEDASSMARTSMPAESPAPPSRGRGRGNTYATPPVGRKRGPGRPPKYPRPEGSDREGSDATPRRGRGGWRGGRGFGRGRGAKLNLQRQQAQPVDKEGQPLEIENDEAKLPTDAEGEEKVDANGALLRGREYRVRTFTIEGRGTRLYMLSTEPARCIGFRDSYLFFQKHRMLYKIILSDDEKLDLIERELMPHSYKGRSIGVVTARSVFREFGAKIVIGGKKIVDDYRVVDVREEGEVEGELAVPEDELPAPGDEYNRNQYVAWHGASQVYHQPAPALPMPGGAQRVESKKRKPVVVTGDNWMLEHARAASEYNSRLAAMRRQTFDGVYDIHTNHMHYPSHLQPTVAKWEQLYSTSSDVAAARSHHIHVNGTASPPAPNGTDTTAPGAITEANDRFTAAERRDFAAAHPGLRAAIPSAIPPGDTSGPLPRFTPPTRYQMDNFATVDYESVGPRQSGLGLPGPDANHRARIGANRGLMTIPQEQIELLPPEARMAFEETLAIERAWKAQWQGEKVDGLRTEPKIAFENWNRAPTA